AASRPLTPEIEAAFAVLQQGEAHGVVIGPGAFLLSRSEQLAALAMQLRVPTIFDGRRFAEAGALMTYGASPADLYHRWKSMRDGSLEAKSQPTFLFSAPRRSSCC